MTTKLITGYTGTKHITPSDDAALHRAIFGRGLSYILPEGDMCKAKIISFTEIEISDGLISLQGKIIRHNKENLSLTTCPHGEARRDIIIVRYTRDTQTLIEKAELQILKGIPVTETESPEEPDIVNNGNIDEGALIVDFPLYRVDYRGTEIKIIPKAEIGDAYISTETENMYKAVGME